MHGKSWRFLILGVIILTSISLACQRSGLPVQVPSSGPAQEETEPESIPDEAQPTKPVSLEAQNGKVGDIFQSGDITLFVPRWDNVLPQEFTKPEVGKKYISADVILVNAGNGPTHFSSFDFYLKDDTGQKYDLDSMATIAAGSDFLSGVEMAPGEKLWTRVGFQVPEDAAGLQLIYDSSDVNTGKIFVELGEEPATVNPPSGLPGETEQEYYPDDKPIEVNGLSITINEVSYSSGAEYLKPNPGTQWLIVDMTVENKTSSSREFSSYIQLLLKDSTGWLCRQDSSAIFATGGSEPNGELTPGEKIRGQVGFVVPEDATGLLLMYDEDSYYPPPKVTIALTLP